MSGPLLALAQTAPSTGGYMRMGYAAILVIFAAYGLFLWDRFRKSGGDFHDR